MTSKELLNTDFKEINKLGTKELRKAVRVLADTANKRIRRLDERGLRPPAVEKVFRSGRTGFSTAGKNRNALLKEFLDASNFLNAKTSTIKGAERQKARMGKSVGGDLTDEQANKLWKAVGRMQELHGDSMLKEYFPSDQLVEIAREIVENDETLSVDDIVRRLNEEYYSRYFEAQESRADYDMRDLGKEDFTVKPKKPGKKSNRRNRKKGL